ncbi:conserved hypothetical protein [Culex quinquefasciatus]|uniref:Uncharacterized protein n=1 Tax=Culex quinquefasciatus TaxID=7176 RepID=B0W5P6_CULQU|nr:conserved hypothetical protein [Culex quinquefasciatus]|eukprot:XP_001844030.1 conserved hypothetical protein [Culex quinquefasciatus]
MFFRRVFAKNGNSSTSGEGSSSTSNSSNNNVSASPARYRRVLNVEDNHRVLSVLQLTPLWEYIIRNNELPVGLNMNELFREFLERLHDPEYQVRQHSLRVLIDVLIVLRDESDVYFAPLLPPIIDNLGHPSPAVRKGALDVLKVYIAQTKMPETVMLEIMNYGMDRNPKDPLSTRYIVGVMLALPSLIQPAILTAKRVFILRAVINALGGKMVQITYQEIALKILLKIKNSIGSREFYECISVSYRRDFDLLCNVYGLPNPLKSPRRETVINLTPPGSEVPVRKSWKPHVPQVPTTEMQQLMQPLSPKAQRWKSGSYNDISRGEYYDHESKSRFRASDDRLNHNPYAISKLPAHGSSVVRRVSMENIDKIEESKVILETEIKINKEAVTMRILEAENSQSISEESDEDNCKRYGIVRVLTDSEIDEGGTSKTVASSSMMQDQSSDEYYSQSADTERSSPPISSDYINNNNNHRPMSAKPSSSYMSSDETPHPRQAAFARRRSVTFDEDDMRTSTLTVTTLDQSPTPSPSPEPPEPPEPLKERPKSSRPKSGRAPKATLEDDEQPESPPPKAEPEQKVPETPDTQSHPEPPETNHLLAEKIEEVKQAIQGIEEKINNVVRQTVEAVTAELPSSPSKLVKADSADAAVPASTPKLQHNLSLEVLLKTSTDTKANKDGGPEDPKDYTKELNIDIPKEEKLNNEVPPQPAIERTSKIPKMIKTGIPKLNTMPSPTRTKNTTKSDGGSQPASATMSPNKMLTVHDRGRSRRRSRSATSLLLQRSIYKSPSALSPVPHSGIEMIHNLLRSPTTSPNRERRKNSTGDSLANDNNNNSIEMNNLNGTKDKCINVNEDDIYDVFGKTIATQTSTEEIEVGRSLGSRSGTDIEIPSIVNVLPTDSSTDAENNFKPQSRPISRASSPKFIEARIVNSWEDLGIVDQVALVQLKSGT